MSNGKIVLTVDDSPSMRREIKIILEKRGLIVREAGSEIGMLNKMEEYGQCVDLVLMDLNLKSEDGFKLISTIRSTDNYKRIPIVIISESAERNNVLLAKLIGVEGYVKKPIDPEELKSKILMILNKPKIN